ncbi:hypothetical protein TEA_027783 [Camellia sinensis var. sinensis]|uniref:Uncharacterized protein n=1 Tax=Camellia sinensis var. sinensis TaxID=542762 RepID=A0A4V3WNK6_CAMSN|nr:hypothetical protein TEA_027783 [Camellia sinensis var. sinensis]
MGAEFRQGIQKQTKGLVKRFDRIFENIIDQRLKMDGHGSGTAEESVEFLQFLLKLKDDGDAKTPLTITHLKALLMDMVVGGTDTTSNTVEFALVEMMNKPQVLRKAQQESCIVGGYTVPKGARVFVNVWVVHRDPSVWKNPLEFDPEQFLGNSKWDYSGNDFNYFPFGSGRRICAATAMAKRMFMFSLASLVHSFDWKLPEGEKLDLEEKFGIVLKKKVPLVTQIDYKVINMDRWTGFYRFCNETQIDYKVINNGPMDGFLSVCNEKYSDVVIFNVAIVDDTADPNLNLDHFLATNIPALIPASTFFQCRVRCHPFCHSRKRESFGEVAEAGGGMVQEVTQRAKDLHDKQFKLPTQKKLPCLIEKNACFECYKENDKNPLKCDDAVKN